MGILTTMNKRIVYIQKNCINKYDQKNIYYKSHYYKKLDSKYVTSDKCTTSMKHTHIQIRERER